MKRRSLVIAILGIAVVATLLLLHSRPRSLDVVWRIEYRRHNATPHMLEVAPEGRIYALQGGQQKLQVQAYGSDGKPLWLAPVGKGAACNFGAAILSVEESELVYVRLLEPQVTAYTLWATIGRHGEIRWRVVCVGPTDLTPYTTVVPTHKYVYSTGGSEKDGISYPTAIKMDYTGHRLWKRIETSLAGISGPAAVDDEGNLILIGDVGAGVGPFVVKYSPEGERIWKREAEVLDGTRAIWVQADKRGRAYTIFALHTGIMTESGDDMSGRNQDYVLSTYSPQGKLLSATKLSQGAWLDIVDAAINGGGEVIAVGNRRKTTLQGYPRGNENAQLIKCDADGKIAWSRAVKLPPGNLVHGVRLDDKGGIYLIGSGTKKSDVKGFLYKVADPG